MSVTILSLKQQENRWCYVAAAVGVLALLVLVEPASPVKSIAPLAITKVPRNLAEDRRPVIFSTDQAPGSGSRAAHSAASFVFGISLGDRRVPWLEQ